MSVIVATAYMDEAERFDWLVAMDAGQVLATGTPAELLERTGTDTLEAAFIALLPEEKRRGHQRRDRFRRWPTTRRRRHRHRGQGPDHALRRFHRRRSCQLSHPPRRDLRLPRLQRLRQDHHHEDADRPAAGQRGQAWLFGSEVDPHDIATRRRVGYMSQAFSLYARADRAPEPGAARAPVPRAARRRSRRASTRWSSASVCATCVDALPDSAAARHPPAPVAGGGDGARARAADPRRADLGRRPDRARQLLAADDRPVAQRRRHDLHLHPFHERGRALRPHLADARRPGAGQRHAGRAGAQARRRARWKRPSSPIWRRPSASERRATPPRRSRAGAAEPTPQPRQRRGAPALLQPRRAPRATRWRETLELRRDPVRATLALLGTAHPDVHHRLRHHPGRREPALRRARPRPDRAEPELRAEPLRFALLRRAAADRRLRRPRPAHAQRRAVAGHRDPARLRARRRSAAQPVQIGAWIDGAMPPRAETVRGYVQGMHQSWLAEHGAQRRPDARRRPAGHGRDALSLQPGRARACRRWCRR